MKRGHGLASNDKKSGGNWPLKIFIITLIISAGVSVVAQVFVSNMSVIAALIVLIFLIAVGVVFDIIGVAFASCPETPFISMASRKIKRGVRALKLLKKAEMVSNICNDVVGDVCGIVSGSAGAAIAAKLLIMAKDLPDVLVSVGISALIAALTVTGKAFGKTFAMKNDVKIVETVGSVMSFFGKRK